MKHLLIAALACACAFGADYKYTAQPGDTITIVVQGGAKPPVVTVPPAATTTPYVGLNLEDVNDWNRARPFADLIKSARCIGGNPATGASQWRVLTVTDNVAPDGKTHGSLAPAGLAGAYTLTCTGGGTITATGATYAGGKLTLSGTQDVDVFFSAPVSGIKLMRPGYTTETFTKEFLADVGKFKCLRFMDWAKTNHGGARGTLTWATRPKPTDQTYTGEWGVPLEMMAALCTAAKTDLWLNVPHDASDDWVTGAASYLKANFAGTVYLEYSNEVWNGIFPQHQASMDGVSTWTGTPSLQPAQNQWYAARHWTWARLVNVSNLFRTVYGDLSRVRPVFADQFASPSLTGDTLAWANQVYPQPPSYYVWAIAAAPYYGPSDTTTTDAAISSMKSSLAKRDDWTQDFLPQFRGMANTYGLRFLGYEGGIDSGQGMTNLDTRIALAYDARMSDLTKNYLAQNAQYMDGQVYFWYASTNSQ